MKKFRKLIGGIVFAIALQSIASFVYADPIEPIENGEKGFSIVEPQYTAISSTSNSLTRKANGDLKCCGATSVRSGYTAWVKVELLKYDGGWHGVTSWTNNSGTLTASINQPYTPSTGQYKLKVTHKAMQGDTEIESTTSYSNVVTVS